MSVDYLILLDEAGHPSRMDPLAIRRSGLREIDFHASPPHRVRVFVGQRTPMVPVPGLGVIVGHVFDEEGTPITNGPALARATSGTRLEQSILGRLWGEYVLIHTSAEEPDVTRVTRDPSGGIPCIFRIRRDEGFITSSISLAEALDLYRRDVDWTAIEHRLSYPYRRAERTALVDVQELLPGCTLTLRAANVDVTVSWSPWEYTTDGRYSHPREAAAGVRRAVATAVGAWAEIDRDVLVELSGGLDSSIVAACLRDTSARVTCCTIMAPVRGTDERLYARQMADQLGVDLHTIQIDFEDARYDFPISRNAVVPGMGILHYAVDRAMDRAGVSHNPNSYFSGAGGDAIFCYLKGASPAADAFREGGTMAGLGAVRDLADLHGCTMWKAGRLTLKKLRRGAKSPHKADSTFLDAGAITDWPEPHPWLEAPSHVLPGDREKVFGLVGTQSYRDGMMRTDSRPMRYPLLSQPVLQTCLNVPTWMWIAEGRNRAVARDAFADRLPADILHRRSKGTYVAYCAALYNRTKGGMLDFLATGQIHARGLLDLPALERFVRADLPPEDQSFMRIMDLCMIENWVRQQR